MISIQRLFESQEKKTTTRTNTCKTKHIQNDKTFIWDDYNFIENKTKQLWNQLKINQMFKDEIKKKIKKNPTLKNKIE